MSRIHEALRKAQQEKTAAVASSAVGAETEVLKPEPVPGPSIPSAEETLTPPMAPEKGMPRLPLTLQTLLERCRHDSWESDSRVLLFTNSHNHAPVTEQFRTLRSRLYQVRQKQPLQTVLVTSALRGEGKSFVALNLTQAIVRQQERHAILIDSDLRDSELHVWLGAPRQPGLSDYLLGEADELSIIQWSPPHKLFFIPGGKPVPNPSELIGNDRLKSLTSRLAGVFDWIILDSPPVIPVADASVLANVSNGILIVVQAAATPFDVVEKARQGFADKPLLGVVLNRVEQNQSYHSYDYNWSSVTATGSRKK